MSNPPSTPEPGRGYRFAARALLTTATAAAFVAAAGVTASAAPNNTGSVIANVNVSSTITLALDQGSFNLNLAPSSSIDKTGAVTGSVTTNNLTGYNVTVQAEAGSLQPSGAGNPDSIPIADLQVSNAAGAYTALSNTAPVITTTKPTRSDAGGDAFSDDYQVTVGDINSDNYHVTLDYTASALA